MDTLAATWDRFAAVIATAAADLGGGWSFHPFPPDAASPPAVWVERDTSGLNVNDPNLGEVTFVVVGALANQPSSATIPAEIALIDAVTAATASTVANGLHRTDLAVDPPGRLEIGGVAYRAVQIRCTVVYSLC